MTESKDSNETEPTSTTTEVKAAKSDPKSDAKEGKESTEDAQPEGKEAEEAKDVKDDAKTDAMKTDISPASKKDKDSSPKSKAGKPADGKPVVTQKRNSEGIPVSTTGSSTTAEKSGGETKKEDRPSSSNAQAIKNNFLSRHCYRPRKKPKLTATSLQRPVQHLFSEDKCWWESGEAVTVDGTIDILTSPKSTYVNGATQPRNTGDLYTAGAMFRSDNSYVEQRIETLLENLSTNRGRDLSKLDHDGVDRSKWNSVQKLVYDKTCSVINAYRQAMLVSKSAKGELFRLQQQQKMCAEKLRQLYSELLWDTVTLRWLSVALADNLGKDMLIPYFQLLRCLNAKCPKLVASTGALTLGHSERFKHHTELRDLLKQPPQQLDTIEIVKTIPGVSTAKNRPIFLLFSGSTSWEAPGYPSKLRQYLDLFGECRIVRTELGKGEPMVTLTGATTGPKKGRGTIKIGRGYYDPYGQVDVGARHLTAQEFATESKALASHVQTLVKGSKRPVILVSFGDGSHLSLRVAESVRVDGALFFGLCLRQVGPWRPAQVVGDTIRCPAAYIVGFEAKMSPWRSVHTLRLASSTTRSELLVVHGTGDNLLLRSKFKAERRVVQGMADVGMMSFVGRWLKLLTRNAEGGNKANTGSKTATGNAPETVSAASAVATGKAK
eukprot:Clim_evm13s53 gene=Clim_evmTU13s53